MTDGKTSVMALIDARVFIESGSFEEVLAALEAVVDNLERGQLSLDDAVAWYEVGLGLSRRCATLLDQAELRITTLDETYRGHRSREDGWHGDDD